MGLRQQQRNKAKIKDSLIDHCKDLPQSGLELESIQLRNTESQEIINIQVLQPDPKEPSKINATEKIPYISQLMLQFGVSYEFYHELSSLINELPRTHKV